MNAISAGILDIVLQVVCHRDPSIGGSLYLQKLLQFRHLGFRDMMGRQLNQLLPDPQRRHGTGLFIEVIRLSLEKGEGKFPECSRIDAADGQSSFMDECARPVPWLGMQPYDDLDLAFVLSTRAEQGFQAALDRPGDLRREGTDVIQE